MTTIPFAIRCGQGEMINELFTRETIATFDIEDVSKYFNWCQNAIQNIIKHTNGVTHPNKWLANLADIMSRLLIRLPQIIQDHRNSITNIISLVILLVNNREVRLQGSIAVQLVYSVLTGTPMEYFVLCIHKLLQNIPIEYISANEIMNETEPLSGCPIDKFTIEVTSKNQEYDFNLITEKLFEIVNQKTNSFSKSAISRLTILNDLKLLSEANSLQFKSFFSKYLKSFGGKWDDWPISLEVALEMNLPDAESIRRNTISTILKIGVPTFRNISQKDNTINTSLPGQGQYLETLINISHPFNSPTFLPILNFADAHVEKLFDQLTKSWLHETAITKETIKSSIMTTDFFPGWASKVEQILAWTILPNVENSQPMLELIDKILSEMVEFNISIARSNVSQLRYSPSESSSVLLQLQVDLNNVDLGRTLGAIEGINYWLINSRIQINKESKFKFPELSDNNLLDLFKATYGLQVPNKWMFLSVVRTYVELTKQHNMQINNDLLNMIIQFVKLFEIETIFKDSESSKKGYVPTSRKAEVRAALSEIVFLLSFIQSNNDVPELNNLIESWRKVGGIDPLPEVRRFWTLPI